MAGLLLGILEALVMLAFVAFVIMTLGFFMMLLFRFASEIGGS